MSALTLDLEPRAIATYDFSEAAQYLHLPKSTVRAWVCGQDGFEPLIVPASDHGPMLSFINLVEIHMLAAIRRIHKVKMPKVRIALQHLGGPHPLASYRLETDGVDLFVRMVGELVNLSKPNQKIMVDVMSAYLKRIRWEDDKAAALFPFPTANVLDGRKSVMIDPRISFGRLVISGTGIATEIVVERFRAGESIDELAKDYRRDRLEIEDVLRFEPALAA
jgi:uncharacterized protein (DUF433 family)